MYWPFFLSAPPPPPPPAVNNFPLPPQRVKMQFSRCPWKTIQKTSVVIGFRCDDCLNPPHSGFKCRHSSVYRNSKGRERGFQDLNFVSCCRGSTPFLVFRFHPGCLCHRSFILIWKARCADLRYIRNLNSQITSEIYVSKGRQPTLLLCVETHHSFDFTWRGSQ